jgi:hypothetical protein
MARAISTAQLHCSSYIESLTLQRRMQYATNVIVIIHKQDSMWNKTLGREHIRHSLYRTKYDSAVFLRKCIKLTSESRPFAANLSQSSFSAVMG